MLWVLCVVWQRSVRRADHSSRGVLPTVVRRCVWSSNLVKEGVLAQLGLSCQKKKKNKCNIYSYEAFTSNKPLFLRSNIISHCLFTKYISHMCLLSLLLCCKCNHCVFSLPCVVRFTGNQLIFVVYSLLRMHKTESTSFLVRYMSFLSNVCSIRLQLH